MRAKKFEVKDPDQPFRDCLLKREPFAQVLTDLLPGMEGGGVISLNNEWGTGKSAFLEMWGYQLRNSGYITLEFNAWENDYEDEPLIPLIAQIKEKIGSKNERSFESILKVGGELLIEGTGMAMKKLADKVVGTGGSDTLVDIVTNGAKDLLKEEIEFYNRKKGSLNEFKQKLGEYLTNEVGIKLPLVFMIDELDRCRPDYAVKVLEAVKHIFSIPNIVFVVSIDKMQLMHSITGFYGSEGINSEEYLRRFFDLEISLPEPNKTDFIKTLLGSNELVDKLKRTGSNRSLESMYLDLVIELLKGLTLRQIEKYITYLSVVLKSGQLNEDSYGLFVYLLYLKIFRTSDYKNIQRLQLSVEELADLINNTLKSVDYDKARIIELDFALSYNAMLERIYEKWHLMYYSPREMETTFRYVSLLNENFAKDYMSSRGSVSIQDLNRLQAYIDLVF